MRIPKRKKERKKYYAVSKHYSKAYHYYNMYIEHVRELCICECIYCICLCTAYLITEYIFKSKNMHSNAFTLVKRSGWTNGKSLLTSGQRCTHSTSYPCDPLHFVNEVRRLKIVPSRLQLLPEFFGPHRGSPRSYSHLIIVIRPSCSGTSVLPANQQLVMCMCIGKTGNSVCLGMCGERVKLVPVHGLAGNTVYCSCSTKKGI